MSDELGTMTRRKRLAYQGMLCLTCMVWGAGFPLSQAALDAGLSSLAVTFLRFALAALCMLPLAFQKLRGIKKRGLFHGIAAGSILFLAFFAQILGLSLTTPSNNAFITSTNVIMVPFLSWLFLKHRPAGKLFFSVLLCFLGLTLLNYHFGQGFVWNAGDWLTLLCAFGYACHIAYLGMTSSGINSTVLSFVQFATVGILALGGLLILEPQSLHPAALGQALFLRQGLWPILFLGIFATCFAFFTQTFVQSKLSPTQTSVILSTEAVFGCLFSVLMGYEALTANMVAGGLLVLCATTLPELHFNRKREK